VIPYLGKIFPEGASFVPEDYLSSVPPTWVSSGYIGKIPPLCPLPPLSIF